MSEQEESGRPLHGSYWLTRFVFLRLLGLLYAIAFAVALRQLVPLLGRGGLLPSHDFLRLVRSAYGSPLSALWHVPSLFWLTDTDTVFRGAAWLGLGLSLLVLLGRANAPILATLWALYMSYVHVGQVFYGYGWEILLLETGFLAIFLCPLLETRPFPASTPPPRAVIWLLRWLLFRVMFGAGLIKLRGDACWRDLTCMLYHYETQPIPNPLSWYFHWLPGWFHRAEVVFNHFVELIVPFSLIAPRRIRHVGGAFLVAFQLLLILSGNLSFLNWLTLTLCVACFDDGALERLLPARWSRRAEAAKGASPSRSRTVAVYGLAALVALLSINPVANMISPGQAMNRSFDPFDLVNTYGAFGSISRERNEVVLQGTDDPMPGPATRWLDYELPCKPGDVHRRPCVVSPYHERLDWQMWFAAMSDYGHEPWLVHLVYQLLRGDRSTLRLFARNPFPDHPPRTVRAMLFRYRFTRPGEDPTAWWVRTPIAEYLPPLHVDDPALLDYLDRAGWSR